MTEGELTGLRKGVVNATTLAEFATEVGLGPYIKLGKGEAATGGRAKPSILSDALEARDRRRVRRRWARTRPTSSCAG